MVNLNDIGFALILVLALILLVGSGKNPKNIALGLGILFGLSLIRLHKANTSP